MKTIFTRKGLIAITPPTFKKIEADISNGFARVSNRIKTIEATIIFGYDYDGAVLSPGDKVLLSGDSGLKPWAKLELQHEGNSFVLCPEAEVIAFIKGTE
jgi:hypothetical protein